MNNDYEKYFPKPSKVTRNKNLKTISVSNAFDGNRIPCKVIASYQAWLKLKDLFEDAFIKNKPVSFKTIEPYLKDRQALKEYYKETPEEFTWHFYNFYIREANLINPLNKKAVKGRGGNKHKLTWLEMHNIRMTARHLYVFLSYWMNQDKKKYPAEVKAFFKAHNVTGNEAISETMRILKEQFKFDFDIDKKNFYDEYLIYKELKSLKKAYQQINYLPIREPLKSL